MRYLVGEVGELRTGQQVGDESPHVVHRQRGDVGVGVAGRAHQVGRHRRPQAPPDEPDAPQVVEGTLHQPPQRVYPAGDVSG